VVVSFDSQSFRSIAQTLGIRAASPVVGTDAAALAVARQSPIENSRSTTPPASNHAPSPAENAPVSVEWTPEFRTKWSHLNRMMSRTSVRALLGNPKWIDTASSPRLEYWLYKDPTIRGEGWIAFTRTGRGCTTGGTPTVWNWRRSVSEARTRSNARAGSSVPGTHQEERVTSSRGGRANASAQQAKKRVATGPNSPEERHEIITKRWQIGASRRSDEP